MSAKETCMPARGPQLEPGLQYQPALPDRHKGASYHATLFEGL